MKRRSRRRLIIVMLSLLLLYSAGYVYCRLDKSIVHYTATAGGECSYHGVDSGDFKIFSVAPALAAFYTPLRYAELAGWKIARPLGGKC